ncbi:MAG: ATP-grasp domain-containing protein [Verrucomicrobia bacterium]|nr:ATP-grasp domain-containing protein [Verrucomicrobiota bacterium]
MARRYSTGDVLFLQAEQMAHDFSLFPLREDPAAHIEGLLAKYEVQKCLRERALLDVDSYIRETVQPSEAKDRMDAHKIIRRLKPEILVEEVDGPLYWAEAVLEHAGRKRRIGILAQNRAENNGVWMPIHHRNAVKAIRGFTQRRLPIVTFIDTPGADAGAEANQQNQAHAISHLIAEMAQIDVPCVGIILGNGYSGGAIPLATVNILLSVRDGVFNTIQPQGLASIARKYDLSWQECAKFVGVSAFELYRQGYIDGIIDYVPGERTKLPNLAAAILSSIDHIERAAKEFVARTPEVFEHYRRSMSRYLDPQPELEQMLAGSTLSVAESPTTQLNVFGVAYRYLRYLTLRKRIHSISVDTYGRLSDHEIPKGDLRKRADAERRHAFQQWLKAPLELRYDEKLLKAWKVYRLRRRALNEPRGRLRRLVFGSADAHFMDARSLLCLQYALYLFNLWKTSAPGNFRSLIAFLIEHTEPSPEKADVDMNVLDVLRQPNVRQTFIEECEDLLVFDTTYDSIIDNLSAVAREAHESNTISEQSIRNLLDTALRASAKVLGQEGIPGRPPEENLEDRLRKQFDEWLQRFVQFPEHGEALKTIETWKKQVFPRLSETLFAIVTFCFENLLPRLHPVQPTPAKGKGKAYDGRIQPKNIGIKDFWNRLSIAYRDLLIQDLLGRAKRNHPVTVRMIIDRFFTNFSELNANLMTADPAGFPGFRLSIEEALQKNIQPCGLITGIGRFSGIPGRPLLGVAISNLGFQAGAFDMASAEKFCALLRECMRRDLPVVCFISSGGMQTKEGAGALFSMPIVNDRLTRFIRDLNLPVICFGFGDCTGGAQASFVTHPLVQTYYFAGTNMPFAGQIVVPSYLPSTATLSNYLSETAGSMRGLVKHPFWEKLDAELESIDPRMPQPGETVEDVVGRILEGRFQTAADDAAEIEDAEEVIEDKALLNPIRKVLIHARGCSAAKLVRKAQEHGISVVLVQSDADADSAVAGMLGQNDTLVCIGGNTPQESYLNALSVIRVAEQEKVHALHPGIGFLSENSSFANLCRSHGINFIGPSVYAMDMMGNKSNAITTARSLGVATVPGSGGIVTTAQAAKKLAPDIGYPVIIKAVHGGGGKGIRVVQDPDLLVDAFRQIQAEAKSAFGNSDVYLEKCITSMRHVEVQILRDYHGNTRVLGLRDCTVQRNNQKVIEESASTMLPANLQQDLHRFAGAIADQIGYTGAGTVEFIYDITANAVYFMEMNTRLQVEHPVTEMTTGVDIVKAQFDIAGGGSIADLAINTRGHAMEVRVNAESLVRNDQGLVTLKPSPGMVTNCYFPDMPDSNLITCIGPGKPVTPYYDNMIAQIICWAPDRKGAIEGMLRYLDGVQIRGVATNIPLLRTILTDDVFVKGIYDTTYLPKLLARTDVDALIRESAATSGATQEELSLDAIRIEGTRELRVVSPAIGVFYLTASPNEPDMVRPGDVISTEDDICMLEAMKLFTSLTLGSFNRDGHVLYDPTKKYRVVRIVPSSRQVVNTGDLMFVVEPVGV